MGPHTLHLPDTRQIAVLILLLAAARLLIPALDPSSLLPSVLYLLRGASHLLWMLMDTFS